MSARAGLDKKNQNIIIQLDGHSPLIYEAIFPYSLLNTFANSNLLTSSSYLRKGSARFSIGE